jgi:hypothetical protein
VAPGKEPLDHGECPKDAKKSIHSMCDRDSYALGVVEIKINGSEPSGLRLEATGCHFVRKERY